MAKKKEMTIEKAIEIYEKYSELILSGKNNTNKDIIVLGIDQGLASIGYCIMKVHKDLIKEPCILLSGTYTTKSKDYMGKRLYNIYDFFDKILEDYKDIKIMSCERLFFFGPRSSSIMPTNFATGVLYMLSENKDLLLKEYPATEVKKTICGDGRAKKEDISYAIERICEINNIQDKKRTEHENDAIAIAYTQCLDYLINGYETMFLSDKEKRDYTEACKIFNKYKKEQLKLEKEKIKNH